MTQKIFVQKLSLFTTINNKNIDEQISHKSIKKGKDRAEERKTDRVCMFGRDKERQRNRNRQAKRKRETQTQRENERHRVMQKETHIKTQIVRETTVKMKQQSEVDRQTRELSNTL